MARASIQQNLERRRTQLDNEAKFNVKYSIVEGAIAIDGTGETMSTVSFPIQFVEKPMFTFGHELDDNVWPTAGSFPVASASVASWVKVARSQTQQYWTGANIAIVVEGNAPHSLLHFTFSGRAFRNPVAEPSQTTDTL